MDEPTAGAVAVFKFLDPGERAFAMTHGACWRDWSEHPVGELIETLIWLKRVMVGKYHIDPQAVEAAFAVIPEYRKYRATRLSRF